MGVEQVLSVEVAVDASPSARSAALMALFNESPSQRLVRLHFVKHYDAYTNSRRESYVACVTGDSAFYAPWRVTRQVIHTP